MTNSKQGKNEHFHPCAICGSESATTTNIVHEFDFGLGNKMKVLSARVPVVKCSKCEEAYFAQGAEEIKHEAVCDFLGRLTPKAIVEIRGKLGMSQTQLAKQTGIGVASIKRWETGIVIQNAALDGQLRNLESEGVVDVQKTWNPTFRTKIPAAIRDQAQSFSVNKHLKVTHLRARKTRSHTVRQRQKRPISMLPKPAEWKCSRQVYPL